MEDVVLFLARALVHHPSDVVISKREKGSQIVFELHVHPDDMGRIIGRQGRIAKSIRSVVRAIAEQRGERVTVEIV